MMRPSTAPSPSSTSAGTTDNYTITHHAQIESQGQASSSGSSAAPEGCTREEAREAIVSSLVQILEQPLSMLRNGTVGDEQMCAASHLIPGSSLGKHLRHVHDHYRILLDSLEAQSGGQANAALKLDYDKRIRILPLETSAAAAVQEFETTQRRVERLLGAGAATWETDLDRSARLTATTPAEVDLGSTLGREMWFVCLHAIHHYALARVILVHELGLQINDSFGVAPSTLVMRLWRQASQERSKL